MLYNVRYRDQLLGSQYVAQGEPIATRLDCEDSPDSVFMEVSDYLYLKLMYY